MQVIRSLGRINYRAWIPARPTSTQAKSKRAREEDTGNDVTLPNYKKPETGEMRLGEFMAEVTKVLQAISINVNTNLNIKLRVEKINRPIETVIEVLGGKYPHRLANQR